MSDYDFVAGGSLKLKKSLGLSEKSKKHKKNKKKKLERALVEKSQQSDENSSNSNAADESPRDNNFWMTEAQKKFLAQQEKRQLERVMSKASKSHKQRVEEFNTHLENLTEHYDIPKVSWTK